VASAEELAVARSSAEAAAEDASDAVSAADALYSEDRSTADAYAAAEAVRSATDAPSFVFEGVPRFANAVAYVACAAGCEAEAAAYASGNDDQTAKVAEKAARAAEEVAQANLLRHLIGNPFRRVRIAPAWLVWNNGTIPKLARAMYEDQAFNRLPILADALEDAGCSNAEILDHCRGPGPHVRGCWVMDAILGKE